jgi:hypothetical protein
LQRQHKDIQHRDAGKDSARISLQVHHRRVWKYREPRNDVIVDIETMMKTSKTGSWKSIEIQALPHGAFTPLMI